MLCLGNELEGQNGVRHWNNGASLCRRTNALIEDRGGWFAEAGGSQCAPSIELVRRGPSLGVHHGKKLPYRHVRHACSPSTSVASSSLAQC